MCTGTGKLQSGLTSSVAKSSDSDAYVNLSLCIHILLICSLVHCSPSILSHRNDLYVIGNGFHMPPTNMLTSSAAPFLSPALMKLTGAE